MSEPRRIFFVAGENSGDQPAGKVVAELCRLRPEWKIDGLGGPRMQKAGMNLLRDMVHDMAIVGIVEVITKSHLILEVYRLVRNYLHEKRPDAVVCVDYPTFNLRLVAPIAHKLGIRIYYYIVPQFWAWDYRRVKLIRKYCTCVFPILPFEADILQSENIPAEYLGHPKVDLMQSCRSIEETCAYFGLDPKRRRIGLIPGSRRKEVDALLPVMLEAAGRLTEDHEDLDFILLRSDTTPDALIREHLSRSPVPVTVLDGQHPDVRSDMRAAFDFSWVKSGTSTLEAALMGKPFVLLYKVDKVSGWIMRKVVRTDFAGLPNIVAGREIVPELLQDDANPRTLVEHTRRYLDNPEAYAAMQKELDVVRETFGAGGSHVRVAEALIKSIEQTGSGGCG